MVETDVIVVGAGPVGAVAASALAQRGISVTLCEAGKTGTQDLRASTFHPPTIEIFDELGFANELIERGLKAPIFHFRDRKSGDTIAFDMADIANATPYPFRIQCEQHIMAGLLTERLHDQKSAKVLFEHRAIAIEQDTNGVVVAFETPYSIEKIRAKYVVAADGGNSIIRKWLGTGFDGFTYPEKFLCLSTKLELRNFIDNLALVNYVADPEEWLVLLRAPSVWRILVPADGDESDAQLLSDENKDNIFARLIGETDVETEHRTIYRVHQRVVKKFDHGRIFLAGDAAHLNNPIGGFGMNSGIHDVWNLKHRIVNCLENGHDSESFAQYDRQRRAVTNSFIQAQTIQNKELLEHGQKKGHAERFARMKATAEDTQSRYEYILRQSMIKSLRDAAEIQ